MSASNQLYQEVILDHNRKPRNWGAVPDANLRAEGHNPLCGDHIVLTLSVGAARTVDALGFEGDGCAICKASASMKPIAMRWSARWPPRRANCSRAWFICCLETSPAFWRIVLMLPTSL